MPADKEIQDVIVENVPKEELKRWEAQAKEIVGTGGDYVSIGPIWSTLDGEFTSDQLRAIADLMYEVKKVCVTGRFSENVMKVAKEVKLDIESKPGQTEGKDAV